MTDWNEQAAPNNNTPANILRSRNLKLTKQNKYRASSSKSTANNEK
ncbi:hypothetical protein [Metabacillus endolithicus]|uniref:Uncharacterized protein n=1 Tax=Metabacillus endolithicus TaxID=1535204 RepID=A0ABW5C4D2_9BACI|nr:hypothetical protein [Metabacillus endolithicus]UPG62043.1 hypothetical protein MVE64_15790 [Metabacillus endolithicus]